MLLGIDSGCRLDIFYNIQLVELFVRDGLSSWGPRIPHLIIYSFLVFVIE